jgi:hypothetical protein
MRALDHNEDEWLHEAIDGSPIDRSAMEDALEDIP